MKSLLEALLNKAHATMCHDSNHNGDDYPDQGCGNFKCWKHRVDDSPPPKNVRIPFCSCEFCREES